MSDQTIGASPGDRAFVDTAIRYALALVLLGQAAAGATDSDIWGHMAFGLDMLRNRQFMWVDPYSFTSDQPWVNHEWLSELATRLAVQSWVLGLARRVTIALRLVARCRPAVRHAGQPSGGWGVRPAAGGRLFAA